MLEYAKQLRRVMYFQVAMKLVLCFNSFLLLIFLQYGYNWNIIREKYMWTILMSVLFLFFLYVYSFNKHSQNRPKIQKKQWTNNYPTSELNYLSYKILLNKLNFYISDPHTGIWKRWFSFKDRKWGSPPIVYTHTSSVLWAQISQRKD